MRFTVTPQEYVIRVYGDHDIDYVAHALVRTYGDRGFMSSIIGNDFYKVIREDLPSLMQQCEVRTLEGYMTQKYIDALTYMLKEVANTKVLFHGMCNGIEMPWVEVTLK